MCNNNFVNNLKNVIGNNITQLRKRAKMTQLELAENLHYTDKAISKWERGETIPSVDMLVEIAKFFDVTLDSLVDPTFNADKTLSVKEKKVSHLAIILLAIFAVWLCASILFTIFMLDPHIYKDAWLVFVYTTIATSILITVGISIWGGKEKRKYLGLSCSAIAWTTILSVYLTLLLSGMNIWMLWILGIPIQAILILSTKIKKS